LEAQSAVFSARNRARIGKVRILDQQIAQSRAEIEGLRVQIEADGRQLALVEDEIADTEALLAKGLTEKPRVLALRRRQAEIEGNIGRYTATIAQVEKAIGEVEVRIIELSTAQIAEAADRLQTVEAELNELGERVSAGDDVLQRTRLTAPVAGRIIDLRVHTIGGVIGAGEAILDIVPTGVRLFVRAEVDPIDIDVVRPGLPAQVRISALPNRHANPIDGRVTSVSADRLVDERSGRAYYVADIEVVAPAGLTGSLQPGMQAEVIIQTGTGTLLGYLAAPIATAVLHGMRQQ
jgi:HlyD family type I secretion membrane fusion protein